MKTSVPGPETTRAVNRTTSAELIVTNNTGRRPSLSGLKRKAIADCNRGKTEIHRANARKRRRVVLKILPKSRARNFKERAGASLEGAAKQPRPERVERTIRGAN